LHISDRNVTVRFLQRRCQKAPPRKARHNRVKQQRAGWRTKGADQSAH